MNDSSQLVTSVYSLVDEFCKEPHGSSNYGKEESYIRGSEPGKYAPMSYIIKKSTDPVDSEKLLMSGFTYSSYNVDEDPELNKWYKEQFGKKMPAALKKKCTLLYVPDQKSIFESVEQVHQAYQTLRDHQIIINGKNLPIQIGEWYAKTIFGLKQVRSTSQRGFDFISGSGKRVEVKVHWNDKSSPKGVKIRKSLVKLSDYIIIMYVAKDFTIRDICFLDSDFVGRKFDGKGHNVFLKDSDVSPYFFSNSTKHFDKVVSKTSLMRFSTSIFAMKLDGRL